MTWGTWLLPTPTDPRHAPHENCKCFFLGEFIWNETPEVNKDKLYDTFHAKTKKHASASWSEGSSLFLQCLNHPITKKKKTIEKNYPTFAIFIDGQNTKGVCALTIFDPRALQKTKALFGKGAQNQAPHFGTKATGRDLGAWGIIPLGSPHCSSTFRGVARNWGCHMWVSNGTSISDPRLKSCLHNRQPV